MNTKTAFGEQHPLPQRWTKRLAPLARRSGGRVARAAGLLAEARESAAVNPGQALSLIERAIALLYSIAGMDQERNSTLGTALLDRGALQEKMGDVRSALQSYLEARQYLPSIPLFVSTFIAVQWAKGGETNPDAIDFYLEVLRSLRDQPLPPDVESVHHLLEQLCVIRERDTLLVARERHALCRKVSEADPSLSWTYYYAGIAHFLHKQYAEASLCFQRARERQSPQPLLLYFEAYSSGMMHAGREEYAQAATGFREACRADPRRARAQFELGRALLQLHQITGPHTENPPQELSEAIESLESALKLRPGKAVYAFHLGEAHMTAGNLTKAIQAFEQAVQLDRSNVEYLLHFGQALRKAGALDAAKAALRSAIRLKQSEVTSHLALASLCLDKQEYDEAIEELRTALALDPQDRDILIDLGIALYTLDRYDEAITMLLRVSDPSPRASFFLARAYAKADHFEQAVAVLKRLAEQQPDDAETLYYLALGHAHQGDYAETLDVLERAIHVGGEQARFYLQRGHAYIRSENLEQARNDYEKALTLRPGDSEILFYLGNVCLALQDEEDARTHFASLINVAPKHQPARLILGALYENNGQIEEAMVQYSASSLLVPNDPSPYRRIGVMRCRQGDYGAAVKSLRKAHSQLGDDSDELLYYLGLAQARSGELEAAQAAWEKLRTRHPEDQRLILNLNRLHYLLGKQHLDEQRLSQAIEVWTAYLMPRPNDMELRKQIAQIHFQLALESLLREGTSSVALVMTALKQAIFLDKDNPIYPYYVALCDLVVGEGGSFLTAVNELLPRLEPALQLHARYHRCIAFLAQGRYQDAETLLVDMQSETEVAESCLDVRTPLAVVYAHSGKWMEAARLLMDA